MKTLKYLNLLLIVALSLSIFTQAFIPNTRVLALGDGIVTYEVIAGKLLIVYSAPDFNSTVLGGVKPGNKYEVKGAELPNAWYMIADINGTPGYFYNDPGIVIVSFVAASGTTNQNDNDGATGDGTKDISVQGSIKGGNISNLPDTVKVIVFVLVFIAYIVVGFMYLSESVRDARWGLLSGAGMLIGATALIIALYAYVNAKYSEACTAGTMCIGNSPFGYVLGGVLLIGIPAAYFILYTLGKRDVKYSDIASTEKTKTLCVPSHQFPDEHKKLVKEGFMPLSGSPRVEVGKEAGKVSMTYAEGEESQHHEGGPVIIYTILTTLPIIGFALFGQGYLWFVHFKTLSEPSAGFSLGAIPFFAMAFLPWIFALIEAVIENNGKRATLWVGYILGWILAALLPFIPPLFTMFVTHLLLNLSDNQGKSFWRGHSDLVALTMLTGIMMFILGAPWFFGIGGAFWQNGSLLTSWSSTFGQMLDGTR